MVSEAFAMAGNAAGAQQQAGYESIIMLLLMVAVFYFLLIRPQQKRAKQHKELIDALKVGDQVITAGGLHGKVAGLQEEVIALEVASGVKIRIDRASVVRNETAALQRKKELEKQEAEKEKEKQEKEDAKK